MTLAKPGERDWASVSSGYLPRFETYEDLRETATKEDPTASRFVFDRYSALGWTPSADTVLVNETSVYNFDVAVLRWNGGHPSEVLQFPGSEFHRFEPIAEAKLVPAPVGQVNQMVKYRTTGALPKGVKVDPEDFYTFEAARAGVADRSKFNVKSTCDIVKDDVGPLGWKVSVSDGTLTVAAISCRTIITGRNGWTTSLDEWDKAITTSRKFFHILDCEAVYPTAIHISDKGETTWWSVEQRLRVCTGE